MDYRIFGVLLMTQILMSLTPGPAVLCVTSQAVSRGALRSVWASLGILAANGLYFVLSGTGVGALLLASYQVFSLVRWVGAAYLIWMGLTAIFGKSSTLAPKTVADDGAGAGRIFLNGLVVQLANPKALVFFTALLPQFLDPQRNLLLQLSIIAAVNMVCDLVALVGYGVLAGRVSHLSDHPTFRRVSNVLAGSMLLTAGVATARLHRG
jgi:threonine/homoserine/homoserine lactone efflux protein